MSDGTVSWFAGIDWGSEKHQVCLLDAAGEVVGERAFRHGGAGLAALCDWLVSVAGEPGRVAVAIEVPHGSSWMPLWSAALPCVRSIPSSSSVCATASAWLGRRMTGVTLGSRQVACARTRVPAR